MAYGLAFQNGLETGQGHLISDSSLKAIMYWFSNGY